MKNTIIPVLKIIVSFWGLGLPLALHLIAPDADVMAYSQYVNTEAETFFIISLSGISVLFIVQGGINILSGIFLLGLTYFDTYCCQPYHDYLAVLFFLSNAGAILAGKRYRWLALVMIFCIPVLTYSIYWYEFIGVGCISVYSLLIGIMELKYLKNEKKY